MDCVIEESETDLIEEIEQHNSPKIDIAPVTNPFKYLTSHDPSIHKNLKIEDSDGDSFDSDSTKEEEKEKLLHTQQIISEHDKNMPKKIQIEEVPEEDFQVEEIQSDLPLEDIRLEELREALVKDIETSALREKLNNMHSSLIELQIENAKLKFERDGHKEDMESYRKRLLLTLQETKQLLQESYLLEERNAFLKKVKDDLETERKQTHQEMIEKMLLARKAARISNDTELALQHLSRAYENKRVQAKQTLEKIEESEMLIKKMQSHWEDLVIAVEEKCREVRQHKRAQLTKRRRKTKANVYQLFETMEELEINNVAQGAKIREKKNCRTVKKL